MAKFEKMIPFILHFAAGGPAHLLSQSADKAFETARRTGWSDDPDDAGGATMIDVTLNTYRTYRLRHGVASTTKNDLRNISFEEWKDILKSMYWDAWKADQIKASGIAHMLVDWVWASGPKTIRNVQRMIGVKEDGIVGTRTLTALNSRNQEAFFTELYQSRTRYYRNCQGAWKYLNGWLRRLNAIRPDGEFDLHTAGREYAHSGDTCDKPPDRNQI